ncbi:MAG: hypothetical protein ACKO7P_01240 [Bacteroidota bacterium]
MKRFLVQLTLFLTPVAIASVGLDYFISYKLKSSKTHAYREYSVWNDVLSGNIKTDGLVLGSSRAWRHIDPKVLEDSLGFSFYNMGMDGQHLPMQLWRHATFGPKNKNPGIIIYSLDYFMLQDDKGLFNKDQFLPYMLYNKEMESFLIHYSGFDKVDFRIPLVRYVGSYNALLHAAKITLFPKQRGEGRVNGFYAENKKWNKDFERAKAEMKKYSAKLDTSVLHKFDSFIKKNISEKNKIVLVYSPEYYEGQLFVENRNEILASFKNISEQNHIPFLDYSSDSISFHKEFFYNTTHLNKTGAEVFSKKLASDLKNLSLTKSSR